MDTFRAVKYNFSYWVIWLAVFFCSYFFWGAIFAVLWPLEVNSIGILNLILFLPVFIFSCALIAVLLGAGLAVISTAVTWAFNHLHRQSVSRTSSNKFIIRFFVNIFLLVCMALLGLYFEMKWHGWFIFTFCFATAFSVQEFRLKLEVLRN